AQTVARGAAVANAPQAPGIIDTNVNLFEWPFRALKYRDTRALVAKLKRHRIIEAWAGSFEALFAKDMDGVNTRLAAECRAHAPGFLVPFGSVNLAWPDWEEDVRRCHEVHRMPGIRIYPGYQPFDLDHAGMESLVKMTSERGLILQVVFGMEDPRVHHPIINVGQVPCGRVGKPRAAPPTGKIGLLLSPGSPPAEAPPASPQGTGASPAKTGSTQSDDLSQFMTNTNTVMDISRLEGNGAVGRMI